MTETIDEQVPISPSARFEAGQRAWLYDVNGDDVPVRVDGLHLPDLGDGQILWVDVDLGGPDDLDKLWSDLMIRDQIDTLDTADRRPQLATRASSNSRF